MFDHTSRYYSIEVTTKTLVNGTTVSYGRRRFLPDPEALPLLAEIAINQGERLDNFTARTLGDPLQFWRVADANGAIAPADLMTEPNRLLRVPLPQP